MNKMNQKRVKTLIKDNAIVNKAIELMDMERSNQNNAVQSFYRTAKAMEKADEYLKSKEFKTELKNADVKDYNKKEIVPLIFGVSYVKYARELQVAKLTQKQVNDFVKAVQKDDKMSVSKQGLLSFVKGKKQVKTETPKPTPKQANEGGQEETKEGGKESNVIAELIVKNVRVQIIDNEGVRSVKTDATPQQVKNALSTFKTMIEALPTKVLSK
jgi:hypothetical protein